MAKTKDEKNKLENTVKNTKPEETAVSKDSKKEYCSEKVEPDTSKSSRKVWLMAIVFGVMVILALSYGYNNVLSKKMLERGCSELSKSPDLKYPTVCVPLDADSNRGDYVDQKSDPMCRCKVDTGNGTSTIIDIRLAN
ncbi:MAG: hypothetical protein ABIF85_06255 [Nanoarchaeota archaeon]|nr:hypothetical protein [Nanoarchaeota archaeon]MBU4300272.1 hypothetical protein [Nanoarchaeota archaeon]MBU4452515.1 hypothetical protein [Nanoarchaeota archaeon]MCG2723219.1 hypothetical protein [archaeon]